MKIKKVKPSGYDINFMYTCPSPECVCTHWISLKEPKVKGFKIVCDCGEVFSPKTISTVTINFVKETTPKKTPTKPETTKEEPKIETFPYDQVKEDSSKPVDFLTEAKKTLINFGFTKEEANQMIELEFEKTGVTNPAKLVTLSLDFLGSTNG